jgi:protein-disulfide isomerase
MIRGRFNSHSYFKGLKRSFSSLLNSKAAVLAVIILFLASLGTKLFLPAYWVYSYPELSAEVHRGTTDDGRPWVGAEHPSLTIEEFTDYQCFQCGKVHLTLRHLVNAYPNTIRLVHYQYPMDENFNTVLVKEPFHTGSGDLALLAIAAGRQDKFWQVNDALYAIARQELTEFNINKFAKKLELDPVQLKEDMYSLPVVKELENDIRTGLQHNIIGTPSFIINDQVYAGHLPPEVLEKIVK